MGFERSAQKMFSLKKSSEVRNQLQRWQSRTRSFQAVTNSRIYQLSSWPKPLNNISTCASIRRRIKQFSLTFFPDWNTCGINLTVWCMGINISAFVTPKFVTPKVPNTSSCFAYYYLIAICLNNFTICWDYNEMMLVTTSIDISK